MNPLASIGEIVIANHEKTEPVNSVLEQELMEELARSLVPETPPPALRTKLLDRVRSMRGTVTLRSTEGEWRSVAEGIDVKRLFFDAEAKTVAFLLRAKAGATLPRHSHHVNEECLVLEGEFTIGDVTLRAGDFHVALVGTDHVAAHARTDVVVYLRAAAADYPFV